jgi:hypothetical protein
MNGPAQRASMQRSVLSGANVWDRPSAERSERATTWRRDIAAELDASRSRLKHGIIKETGPKRCGSADAGPRVVPQRREQPPPYEGPHEQHHDRSCDVRPVEEQDVAVRSTPAPGGRCPPISLQNPGCSRHAEVRFPRQVGPTTSGPGGASRRESRAGSARDRMREPTRASATPQSPCSRHESSRCHRKARRSSLRVCLESLVGAQKYA